MKKQNVNNKLAFNKASVIELNDNQMNELDGGTSLTITTVGCIVVSLIVTIAQQF